MSRGGEGGQRLGPVRRRVKLGMGYAGIPNGPNVPVPRVCLRVNRKVSKGHGSRAGFGPGSKGTTVVGNFEIVRGYRNNPCDVSEVLVAVF